jgi:hypothetical protein
MFYKFFKFSVLRKTVAHQLFILFLLQVGWLTGQAPAFDAFNCNQTFTPLNATAVSQLTSSNAFTIIGQNITITGTLIVDRDLNILNCRIVMLNGAQIVVEEGKRLLMSNTRMSTCGSTDVHNGIVVRNKARFWLRKTLIRNASIALKFVNGYTPTAGSTNRIEDCTFYNCGIAISAIKTHTNGDINLGSMKFTGNHFLRRSGNDGAPIITELHSLLLDGVTGSFGFNGSTNRFGSEARFSSPITIKNSNVALANCDVYCLGTVINSEKSFLKVGTATGGLKCRFYITPGTSVTIVTTKNFLTTVKGCEFYGDFSSGAIRCLNNETGSEFHIDENLFDFPTNLVGAMAITATITVDRPSPAEIGDPNCSINTNRVLLTTASPRSAIFVRSVNSKSGLEIMTNEIRYANAILSGDAIEVNGQNVGVDKGMKINDNQIYYDYSGPAPAGPFEARGIVVERCVSDNMPENRNEISGNIISTNYHTSTPPIDFVTNFFQEHYVPSIC